jgi:hypothetical protein
MKRLTSFLLTPSIRTAFLLVCLFLFGSDAQAFSTGSPWRAWPFRDIRVCWMDGTDPVRLPAPEKGRFSTESLERIETLSQRFAWAPLREEWKTAIQTKITEEFTLDETGIRFVGWKNCIQGVESTENGVMSEGIHVVILSGTNPGDGRAGEADLGSRDTPHEKPALRYVFLSGSIPDEAIDPVIDIQATALHEFGHIAGLHHEQMRAPSGELRSGYSCYAKQEQFEFLTPIDRLSIMHEEQLQRVTRLGTFCIAVEEEQSEIDQDLPEYPECKNQTYSWATLALFFERIDPRVILTRRETPRRIVLEHRVALSSYDIQGLRVLYPR